MKQAEISVLNGLYKNAAVGKDAIFCVLEHTQDAVSYTHLTLPTT